MAAIRSRTNEEIPKVLAMAEYAVASALGHKWEGAFTNVTEWRAWKRLKREVRMVEVCVGDYATAPLIVRESDPDVPFILVIDRKPEFLIIGWMFGADAKKPEWWNAVDKCFDVPQTELRACTELRDDAGHGGGGGGRRRDPAPDFGGTGRWPQMRYADDGSPPSKYGNVVTASWDTPCCRCQTIIPKGGLVGGNLVTGSIHGDPLQCKMKKRR